MAELKILEYPDKFLKKTAADVKNIDGKLQQLIDDMAETMYRAPGVGLAAIQAGVDQSLLVYDVAPREDGRELHVLINPKIIEAEGSVLSEAEGCLSVPEYRADVNRHTTILVEGYDRDEKPVRLEATDFEAIVLQHEIDHLNGVLFIDRISSLKRQLYRRKRLKQLKTNG
jgi:peptide deformylase